MRRDRLCVDAGHTQPTVGQLLQKLANPRLPRRDLALQSGQLVGVERVLEDEITLLIELASLLRR